MSDERDKFYRPVFDDGKHLAKDKDGYNLGSTLNDTNNKLSGQARWVEVDPNSFRTDTSFRDEILTKMAVRAVEIGVSYFVEWAAPRIVDFWHETVLPAAKKQFWRLVDKASSNSEKTSEEMNSTISSFDMKQERIEETISETEKKWTAYHNSPEYRQRKEQVNKGIEQRKAYFESPEFQKKREEMMRKAEKFRVYLESPEYQKKREKMMRKAEKFRVYLESPEYQKKREEMMQRAEKFRAYLESPEYQQRRKEIMRKAEERKAYFESPEYQQKVKERRRRAEERIAQSGQGIAQKSDKTQIAVLHSDIAENKSRESENNRFNKEAKRPMLSEEYQLHVENIKNLAFLLAHEIKAISDAYEVEQMTPDRRIEARTAVEELTSKVFMDGVSCLLMDENRALLDQNIIDILQAFKNRCFLIYGQPVPIELLAAGDDKDDK